MINSAFSPVQLDSVNLDNQANQVQASKPADDLKEKIENISKEAIHIGTVEANDMTAFKFTRTSKLENLNLYVYSQIDKVDSQIDKVDSQIDQYKGWSKTALRVSKTAFLATLLGALVLQNSIAVAVAGLVTAGAELTNWYVEKKANHFRWMKIPLEEMRDQLEDLDDQLEDLDDQLEYSKELSEEERNRIDKSINEIQVKLNKKEL